MSDLAREISDQIVALEDECARYKRDAAFYERLLVQLAMMNGGSLIIDPAFGHDAVAYVGGWEINSTGFHLKEKA